MIPLPLTALHDTLKAGDELCTVPVTVTPCTLAGSACVAVDWKIIQADDGVVAGVIDCCGKGKMISLSLRSKCLSDVSLTISLYRSYTHYSTVIDH